MMNQAEISKDDFVLWLSDRVTRYVLNVIAEERDLLKDELCGGVTLSSDKPEIKTAMLIGYIGGLNQLLNIRYDDEDEEIYADRTVRI